MHLRESNKVCHFTSFLMIITSFCLFAMQIYDVMLEIAGVMKSFVRKNKTLFHIVIKKRYIAYNMKIK